VRARDRRRGSSSSPSGPRPWGLLPPAPLGAVFVKLLPRRGGVVGLLAPFAAAGRLTGPRPPGAWAEGVWDLRTGVHRPPAAAGRSCTSIGMPSSIEALCWSSCSPVAFHVLTFQPGAKGSLASVDRDAPPACGPKPSGLVAVGASSSAPSAAWDPLAGALGPLPPLRSSRPACVIAILA